MKRYPLDHLLKTDRIPHIWCSGCGIGIALSAYLRALDGFDLNKVVLVSGVGCAGRAAGYLNLDSYHTTHGRAIPFATGLKLAQPELNVTVFSGDGDLVNIGTSHTIHAMRRNMDLTVICINNFNFGMTGSQVAATTPLGAITSTTRHGNPDPSWNLPHLAIVCGASFVARWTCYDAKRLEKTISYALNKKGLSFIEVISPCPTGFMRANRIENGMKFLKENRVIKHDASMDELKIELDSPIMVGRFWDK